MTYAVKEIFYTLQGEGANAGRSAVFCHAGGCVLHGDDDRLGGRRVLVGVGEQVGHHLLQPGRIAPRGRRRVGRDVLHLPRTDRKSVV